MALPSYLHSSDDELASTPSSPSNPPSGSALPAVPKHSSYSTKAGVSKSSSTRHSHLRTRSSDYAQPHQLVTSTSAFNLHHITRAPTLRHYYSLSEHSLSEAQNNSNAQKAASGQPSLLPAAKLGSSPMSYSSAAQASSPDQGLNSNLTARAANLRIPDDGHYATTAPQTMTASSSTSSFNFPGNGSAANPYGSSSSLMSYEESNNNPALHTGGIPPAGTYGSSSNMASLDPSNQRLHYNHHSTPRLQFSGQGSNIPPAGATPHSPHRRYSPMNSSHSPSTPKTNTGQHTSASVNPWASPYGTPSHHHLSPQNNSQSSPLPFPLPPPQQQQPGLHPHQARAQQQQHHHHQQQQQNQLRNDSYNSGYRQQMAQNSLNPGVPVAGAEDPSLQPPSQFHPAMPQHQQQTLHPLRRTMVHHNSTSQIGPPMLGQILPHHQPQATPMVATPSNTLQAPQFRHVRSKSELTPVIHNQPKFRRAHPEGGSLSPLAALTKHLSTTYHICNPAFNYQSSKNPKRILTKPGEGKLNNGYDNADSDYILYVNDILGIDEQRRYAYIYIFFVTFAAFY